jgi:transmembrane sensor
LNRLREIEAIEAEASSWDARLRAQNCSPGERARFDDWLQQDPLNRDAFERLQIALASLREAGQHPMLRSMRESAHVLAGRSLRRRVLIRWSTAASIGVVAIIALVFGLGQHYRASSSRYTTTLALAPPATAVLSEAPGVWMTGAEERRTFSLPDGSSVTLNASSRLGAEWLPHERRIRLLSGQALFRVAKDQSRPFIVTAGERTVTALGTAFDVRLTSDSLQVTLIEGQVAVKRLRLPAVQAIELAPSQQLRVVDGEGPTIRRVDAMAEAAWADGQVFFTDKSLPDAVAEMNQYSAKQVVAGRELAAFRVNGMFRSGNQDSFVTALTSYFPVEAHAESNGRIVLTLRQEPGAVDRLHNE